MDESCHVKMTHVQIDKHLGTAREVVSRMLKYFADEGYIIQTRGSIKIKTIKELKKLI